MKKSIQRPAGLTEEMVKAAEGVFVSMAYVQAIRPTVEAYKAEVFAKFDFFPAEKTSERMMPDLKPNGAILHEKDNYLAMTDGNDSKTLAPYWEALHERHLSEGFEVVREKGVGYCPLLIAEHEEVKSRWALEKAFEPIHKLSDVPYSKTKQLQELCLKLAAPFVRSTEELMAEVKAA
jgi:deoxyxylulose-5-phosphate synthase